MNTRNVASSRAFEFVVLMILFCSISPQRCWAEADGFVELFNGRDLSGWKGLVGDPKSRNSMSAEQLAQAQAKADEKMRAHWSAENGVLVFDGHGDNLCTVKDYANFELLVDFKIEEKGDSGTSVRLTACCCLIGDVAWEPFGVAGTLRVRKWGRRRCWARSVKGTGTPRPERA